MSSKLDSICASILETCAFVVAVCLLIALIDFSIALMSPFNFWVAGDAAPRSPPRRITVAERENDDRRCCGTRILINSVELRDIENEERFLMLRSGALRRTAFDSFSVNERRRFGVEGKVGEALRENLLVVCFHSSSSISSAASKALLGDWILSEY